MKRLVMLVMALGCWACVAGPNPGTEQKPPPDYCDPHAASWDNPGCTIVRAQGAFEDDLRYVCPQADGTEWEMRVVTAQNGDKVQFYHRYETYADGPAAHIPTKTLCFVPR